MDSYGTSLAVELDVDEINMSLGGRYNTVIEDETIEKAIQKGIVVVRAAGNRKILHMYMPVRRLYIIAVAAGKHRYMKRYINGYGVINSLGAVA